MGPQSKNLDIWRSFARLLLESTKRWKLRWNLWQKSQPKAIYCYPKHYRGEFYVRIGRQTITEKVSKPIYKLNFQSHLLWKEYCRWWDWWDQASKDLDSFREVEKKDVVFQLTFRWRFSRTFCQRLDCDFDRPLHHWIKWRLYRGPSSW